MKILILVFCLSVGSASQAAARLPSYFMSCQKAALKKLHATAVAKGYEMDPESIRATHFNLRWYSPSKYIWFSVEAYGPYGTETLQTRTQKSPFHQCF